MTVTLLGDRRDRSLIDDEPPTSIALSSEVADPGYKYQLVMMVTYLDSILAVVASSS